MNVKLIFFNFILIRRIAVKKSHQERNGAKDNKFLFNDYFSFLEIR